MFLTEVNKTVIMWNIFAIGNNGFLFYCILKCNLYLWWLYCIFSIHYFSLQCYMITEIILICWFDCSINISYFFQCWNHWNSFSVFRQLFVVFLHFWNIGTLLFFYNNNYSKKKLLNSSVWENKWISRSLTKTVSGHTLGSKSLETTLEIWDLTFQI